MKAVGRWRVLQLDCVLCTTWHKGCVASLDEFTVGSNGAVSIWFIFHNDEVLQNVTKITTVRALLSTCWCTAVSLPFLTSCLLVSLIFDGFFFRGGWGYLLAHQDDGPSRDARQPSETRSAHSLAFYCSVVSSLNHWRAHAHVRAV